MSQSVPAVVSDVGGMPELVEDGVSGLVVAPSDPTALAEALLTLEQDRTRLASMRQAARTRIQNDFTVARATDHMETLFAAVLR
jgi:glycosyltransferase involved in cell wall biosynthesis